MGSQAISRGSTIFSIAVLREGLKVDHSQRVVPRHWHLWNVALDFVNTFVDHIHQLTIELTLEPLRLSKSESKNCHVVHTIHGQHGGATSVADTRLAVSCDFSLKLALKDDIVIVVVKCTRQGVVLHPYVAGFESRRPILKLLCGGTNTGAWAVEGWGDEGNSCELEHGIPRDHSIGTCFTKPIRRVEDDIVHSKVVHLEVSDEVVVPVKEGSDLLPSWADAGLGQVAPHQLV
mmetsp:Transcript_2288/g.2539  ORF Transcript_2288/g.2539 Transcript_2288/m.2539 type:complete len:233 (-) Transcript_2288:2266-2964(-)